MNLTGPYSLRSFRVLLWWVSFSFLSDFHPYIGERDSEVLVQCCLLSSWRQKKEWAVQGRLPWVLGALLQNIPRPRFEIYAATPPRRPVSHAGTLPPSPHVYHRCTPEPWFSESGPGLPCPLCGYGARAHLLHREPVWRELRAVVSCIKFKSSAHVYAFWLVLTISVI